MPVHLNHDFSQPINNSILFYIHDIVINPNEKGKGLGKSLMTSLLEVGRTAGFNKFMAIAVSEDGRRILEKFDFSVVEQIQYAPKTKGFRMIRG